MTQQSTVQRAFELARGGQCRSLEELARRLSREGHGSAAYHLAGREIRRQLRGLIKAAGTEHTPALPSLDR